MENILIKKLLWGKDLNSDHSIQSMLVSPYAMPMLCACNALETDKLYKSPLHGQGHIERVMLMGALIAKARNFTRHETELLLFACAYHDIGRINDSKDDDHGRRSAQMIIDTGLWERFAEGSEDELKVLRTAICTHSVSDDKLPEIAAEFGVKEELMPFCEEICCCLKDADNLDRVRLNDLDPAYLRRDCSLKLVPTAEFVYRTYKAHEA